MDCKTNTYGVIRPSSWAHTRQERLIDFEVRLCKCHDRRTENYFDSQPRRASERMTKVSAPALVRFHYTPPQSTNPLGLGSVPYSDATRVKHVEESDIQQVAFKMAYAALERRFDGSSFSQRLAHTSSLVIIAGYPRAGTGQEQPRIERGLLL